MTARGVDFLELWIERNVLPLPVTGDVLIRTLAQKLRDDSSAAGFTIDDLEIENSPVETSIRETMVFLQGLTVASRRRVFLSDPVNGEPLYETTPCSSSRSNIHRAELFHTLRLGTAEATQHRVISEKAIMRLCSE